MNIIQNNENKQKIKKVFCRYSHNTKIIPNQVFYASRVENKEIFYLTWIHL